MKTSSMVMRSSMFWRGALMLALGAISICAREDAPTQKPKVDHACSETVVVKVSVDHGHAWRPPFDLERVGAKPIAHVRLDSSSVPARAYSLVAYRNGLEVERHALAFTRVPESYLGPGLIPQKREAPPFFAHVPLSAIPTEVALIAQCGSVSEELARQSVAWPEFEADAVARPDTLINPVDLGAILPPADWLLIVDGQTAVIKVAALAHHRDLPNARLEAWFEGAKPKESVMPLARGIRATRVLELKCTAKEERTVLHVRLADGERELWKKTITTMFVRKSPTNPIFGAIETKLRYDAPISVNGPGSSESLDYSTAWREDLNDVVVFLPNGSRFVFWRGASYVPFWAGKYNTGVNYQWAETGGYKDAVDTVEPLMDKELRYGKVRIIEATPARVHVRWTYQSTDFVYKVWGDQAVEDFYFYPDGISTRVLTLASAPEQHYQVTEFLVVAPQSAYPLSFLPSGIIDMLYLDGSKRSLTFPDPLPEAVHYPTYPHLLKTWKNPPPKAAMYRIHDHKDDPASAIYFSPRDIPSALTVFDPFYEKGELVTPAYWGDHWPLGRGAMTGGSISSRILSSPSHNSLMGGAESLEGKPLSVEEALLPDALGRTRKMTMRRWAWLIGKTDMADQELLEVAKSYSVPPSLVLEGARVDLPSYSPERRALRLVVERRSVDILIRPESVTVNPVFELSEAPPRLSSVKIEGRELRADDYAWDGTTLWVKARIGTDGAKLSLQFSAP